MGKKYLTSGRPSFKLPKGKFMKFRERLFLTTIILGLISVGVLFSKETAISKIGREVLLLDDGTWSEFNRELLALEPLPVIVGSETAITKSGLKVRLEENGTWVKVTNQAETSQKNNLTKIIHKNEQPTASFTEVFVKDVSGRVMVQLNSHWKLLEKSDVLIAPVCIKTGKNGRLKIELTSKNELKLAPNTEIQVKPTKSFKQACQLYNGELTVSLSKEGRDSLLIILEEFNILGCRGLFKVFYATEKGEGKVVVKNGFVEVTKGLRNDEVVKCQSFYEIYLKNGLIGEPQQATIIKYDW